MWGFLTLVRPDPKLSCPPHSGRSPVAPHRPPAPGMETRAGAAWGPATGTASPTVRPPCCPAGPQFRCTPPTPVDLIFLVDGSWSIGHSHFRQVKGFLASIIEPFEIGPDKVQVGGCQPAPCPLPLGPTAHQPPVQGGGGGNWRAAAAARPGGSPHLDRWSSWLGGHAGDPCTQSGALQTCAPPVTPGSEVARILPLLSMPTATPGPLPRPDPVQWRPPDRVGPEHLSHQGGGAGRRAQSPLQRREHVHGCVTTLGSLPGGCSGRGPERSRSPVLWVSLPHTPRPHALVCGQPSAEWSRARPRLVSLSWLVSVCNH